MNTTYIKNETILPNRDINTETVTDFKALAQYYRASMYKMTTIRHIIHSKFDVTDNQIKNAITNFAKKYNAHYRAYENKDEIEIFYKSMEMKHWGKSYPIDFEYTENRPLRGGDYRKFRGTTKTEKKLLRSIRK